MVVKIDKKFLSVGSGGIYFSNQNGEIALMCPHCGRWFAVDIDDYLPVHSRLHLLRMKDAPPEAESLDSLCDGSYNTKGVKGK
jgi:uncharacterized C2H2 Zn-finger protein